MFSVAEIMSTELCTLQPSDNLAQARQCMLERRIRHIPVVDEDGALLGLVSHRDLLAAADSSLLEDQEAHRDKERFVALSTVMSQPVQTVGRRENLRAAGLLMQGKKVGCLPVVDDRQRLVGILTDSDYVAVAINLLEQIEEGEEELLETDG